jgi:hypothetical protein
MLLGGFLERFGGANQRSIYQHYAMEHTISWGFHGLEKSEPNVPNPKPR